MKTPLIRGTIAALTLTGLMAFPALADNSTSSASPSASATGTAARGKHHDCPSGFDAGDAAGVRICRGKNGDWRLDTTDPAKSGSHEYTGTLTIDGKFVDVQLIRPESDDSASIDGEGKLNFDLKTYSGIDGVSFRVGDDAKEVTFNLFVDGQQLAPSHIWIGHKGRHPKADPFKLPTGKHEHRVQPSAAPSPVASTAASG